MTTRGARLARVAMIGVPLAFLAVFFVYPVVTIVGRGLWPDGSLDLQPIVDVFTDASLREVAWFTVWQATLSTVLTLAIGIPGAFVLARFRFRGAGIARSLIVVPFVLPTVVVGSAFLALGIGPSLGAILVAHVFFNYAVVVRTVGGLWAHLDPRQEDAARMLGASRLRAFTAVTLPALRPAIFAAAAIVFLFTFTSFGVVLVLGGPTHSTLETEIYRQTAQLLDLQTAAALSVVQLLAVLALLVVTERLAGRRGVALTLRGIGSTARRARTTGDSSSARTSSSLSRCSVDRSRCSSHAPSTRRLAPGSRTTELSASCKPAASCSSRRRRRSSTPSSTRSSR